MNHSEWTNYFIYPGKREQRAMMTLVIVFTLISLIYQSVNIVSLVRSKAAPAASQAETTKYPKPVPSIIAAVALFGDATKTAAQVANMNLPTTNLQLTLRGAVVESDQSKSSAVIEEPGKPALSYQVGDTLPGNVSLNAVFADHVVLKRNGQLETLKFPPANKLNIKANNIVAAGVEDETIEHEPPPPPEAITAQSVQERLLQLQEEQHKQRGRQQ